MHVHIPMSAPSSGGGAATQHALALSSRAASAAAQRSISASWPASAERSTTAPDEENFEACAELTQRVHINARSTLDVLVGNSVVSKNMRCRFWRVGCRKAELLDWHWRLGRAEEMRPVLRRIRNRLAGGAQHNLRYIKTSRRFYTRHTPARKRTITSHAPCPKSRTHAS